MSALSYRLLLPLAMGGFFFSSLVRPASSEQSQATTDEDLLIGIWVLDTEASSYRPGPTPKHQTRTYEKQGDKVVSLRQQCVT